MMIVLLGPDGSGKSTVLKGVEERLAPSFSEIQSFHLRFPWFPHHVIEPNAEQKVVTAPHAQPPYPLLISICKLLYFIIRYQLSYWANQRNIESKDTLILFDRYYQDLVVDPCRFRYAAPGWLAEKASLFIPGPHAFILLDAPVEILQKRKQEVPFSETERQRQAYLQLIQSFPNGYVVNASDSPEMVISKVESIILKLQTDLSE